MSELTRGLSSGQFASALALVRGQRPTTPNDLSGKPRDKNVYHDHDSCPSGERIKRKHGESGPCKNRRLCELCGILNRLDEAQHLVAEVIKQMSV